LTPGSGHDTVTPCSLIGVYFHDASSFLMQRRPVFFRALPLRTGVCGSYRTCSTEGGSVQAAGEQAGLYDLPWLSPEERRSTAPEKTDCRALHRVPPRTNGANRAQGRHHSLHEGRSAAARRQPSYLHYLPRPALQPLRTHASPPGKRPLPELSPEIATPDVGKITRALCCCRTESCHCLLLFQKTCWRWRQHRIFHSFDTLRKL